jgi:O-antigen ligase
VAAPGAPHPFRSSLFLIVEFRAGFHYSESPLAFAYAAAVSFGLLYSHMSFTRIAVGFVAMLVVLPLAILRYETAVLLGVVLLGAVRFEPAPSDAVFAIVMLVALLNGRFGLRRLPFAPTALLLAFFAVNLLSSVLVIDPHRAVRFLSITLYLGVFALWLTGYLKTHARVQALVRAYLLAAVVSAVIGTIAVIFRINTFLEFGDRARGFFKDANVYGPFMIPAAMIVLDEILTPRILTSRRIVKVAMFAVLSLAVLFSFSRAAWLNYGVALVVYAVVTALRRNAAPRLLSMFFMVLLLAVMGTTTLVVTNKLHFLEQRANKQSYDTQRFSAQGEGLRLARQNPAGVGPGQFEVEEGQEGNNEIVVGRPVSAHSTYVRVFAEQGFIGIIVFVALVAVTLMMAARSVAIGRDTYGVGSAPLLAAWCGLLLNSLVIDTLHWRHLWLVAALIWAGAMRRAVPEVTPARTAELPTG